MATGWLLPVMLCILLYGGMVFLPKLAVETIPPLSAIIYEVIGGLTVALIVLLYIGGKPQFEIKGAAYSYAVGLCGFTGTLAYFWAVTKGPVSLVAVLTAMYPIVAIMLGVFFLHETLSVRQMAGIALSLLGVLLMAK